MSTSMPMNSAQQDRFRERLSRIQAGGETTNRAIHLGGEREVIAKPDPEVAKAKARRRRLENIRFPAMVVGGFLTGVLAVFLSRWVRASLMADAAIAGDGADMMLALDAGMAMAVGFALKMLFRLESKELVAAQGAGVFCTLAVMHNLVHAYPATFGVVYSPQWVATVVTTTEPGTIRLGGFSFAYGEASRGTGATAPGEAPEMIELRGQAGFGD